eukprot:g23965.t1
MLSFVANRAQVLCKAVFEPPLGLTDVEGTTSGSVDAVNDISKCAGEYVQVTSADICHVISSTASHASSAATHTADATASVTDTKSTAYIKAPADAAIAANIKDNVTSADNANIKADIAAPTADVTPNSIPTATSSTANPSPKPCRVFTIPPDLPLTEDK